MYDFDSVWDLIVRLPYLWSRSYEFLASPSFFFSIFLITLAVIGWGLYRTYDLSVAAFGNNEGEQGRAGASKWFWIGVIMLCGLAIASALVGHDGASRGSVREVRQELLATAALLLAGLAFLIPMMTQMWAKLIDSSYECFKDIHSVLPEPDAADDHGLRSRMTRIRRDFEAFEESNRVFANVFYGLVFASLILLSISWFLMLYPVEGRLGYFLVGILPGLSIVFLTLLVLLFLGSLGFLRPYKRRLEHIRSYVNATWPSR